jgi:hypothetical protein
MHPVRINVGRVKSSPEKIDVILPKLRKERSPVAAIVDIVFEQPDVTTSGRQSERDTKHIQVAAVKAAVTQTFVKTRAP